MKRDILGYLIIFIIILYCYLVRRKTNTCLPCVGYHRSFISYNISTKNLEDVRFVCLQDSICFLVPCAAHTAIAQYWIGSINMKTTPSRATLRA